MAIIDLEGVILDWTEGATRLLGWTPDEAIGRSWDDLAGPPASDPDPRRIELRQRRDAGEAFRGELTVRTAFGERIPILVDGGPLRDDDGTVIGSVVLAMDDRRRSAAEERFETAFRAAPIASAITMLPHHLVVDVNPAFEALSGYSRAAAVGRTAAELDLWTALADRDDVVARIASGAAIPELATQMRTASGAVVDVRLSGRPIAATDGPAYLWMAVDESDQVRVEERLRAAAARLTAMVDASPMAIVLLDLEFRIQLFNPAAEALFGWSATEVLGRRNPIQAADPGAALADFTAALRGATIQGDEMVVFDRGGRERIVSVAAAPVRDETGVVTGSLFMAADISEREQLQAQLREAQKMESIGFLAGGIAHDFNNIMTAVGGYAAMAMDAVGPDHPAQADLEEIARATVRATALTRQLLTFSRRQVVHPTVLDLGVEVDELQTMVRRLLDADIELRIDAPTGTAWVRADPSQIQQVVLNLAVNAREAMPGGGTLRLTVESDPPGPSAEVRLSVIDTGHGMDAELASHAFEPFFTTKPAGEGTGLGLAVVHGIAEGSGGHVGLRSRPGEGTTVTVAFPRVEPDDAPVVEGLEPVSAASNERAPATILVVDDEAALRSLARRVLETAGYRVEEAGDGVEALEVAAGMTTVDLLLTDLTMPRSGGVALAAALTEQRPGLLVVYMSGYGEARLAEGGVLDPSVRLLSKPFSVVELADAVAGALEEADPA